MHSHLKFRKNFTKIEIWRTEKREITKNEIISCDFSVFILCGVDLGIVSAQLACSSGREVKSVQDTNEKVREREELKASRCNKQACVGEFAVFLCGGSH